MTDKGFFFIKEGLKMKTKGLFVALFAHLPAEVVQSDLLSH